MKRTLTLTAPALVALAAINLQLSTAFAQGTAFTYQGRLNDTGQPANGSYDFRFRLASDPLGNNYVGSAYFTNGVDVSNGLFTTALDFGAGIFAGSNYWLEVGVRTNNGGSYIVLEPLQALTPAPYAIMANTASNLLGTLPAGQLSGTVLNGALPTSPNFSGTVTASSFSGNGGNVTNVNALTLGGLGSGAFWQLGGNNAVGGQFLGTTNNQALEFRVGGQQALLITPSPADAANIIGGAPGNQIDAGIQGSVIAGGGTTNFFGDVSVNRISEMFASIGGGGGNWIQPGADHSVIGGGLNNLIGTNANDSVISGGVANTNLVYSSVIGGGQNNTSSGQYAVVAGGLQNTADIAAFVGGGHGNNAAGVYATVTGGYVNTAGGYYATVAGGWGNAATGENATVAGGKNNGASGPGSFIGGGGFDGSFFGGNSASGTASVIGGGFANSALGYGTVVAGGQNNHATNDYAACPGGATNTAGGLFSFAAGHQAMALHQGTFVWADSQPGGFPSTANDQFLIRAQGGVGINTSNPNGASFYTSGNRTGGFPSPMAVFENTSSATNASPALRLIGQQIPHGVLSVSANVPANTPNSTIAMFGNTSAFVVIITNDGTIYCKGTVTTSDRNAKENFTALDSKTVLSKIVAMPVTEWNYKEDGAGKRHIGPVAQDFHAAFGLNGGDDTHIATVDEAGVALAAIQGLNQQLEDRSRELVGRSQEFEIRSKRLEAENADLKQENESLEKRLDALEKIIRNQK